MLSACLVCWSLLVSGRELTPTTFIAAGVEQQVSLDQATTFNGVFIAARKSLLTSLVLSGQWRVLRESIANNDFQLQQQALLLGYPLYGYGDILWLFSLGGQHQRVKHEAKGFASTNSEYGPMAVIEANYSFDFQHEIVVALQYREMQDHERYGFRAGYFYRPAVHWQFGIKLTLGYNQKFTHDLNEYRLTVRYLF